MYCLKLSFDKIYNFLKQKLLNAKLYFKITQIYLHNTHKFCNDA